MSNINLSLGEKYIRGKQNDLSGLGCELNDWVDFKLLVRDKSCEIYINEKLRFTETFSSELGHIVGFKFKFNGVGQVDRLSLSNMDKKVVFSEDFNQSL